MRFRGRPQYFVQQQPIAQPALAPQAPDQPGYLLIQVSTAQGAIPIPGASIVISIGDDLIYNSICDATVYFPGYYTNIYKNVQIFPGITSLQNVFLIPLPESQQNERLTIVYDASPHSLYEEGAE